MIRKVPIILFVLGIFILLMVYIYTYPIKTVKKIEYQEQEVITVKPDAPFINMYPVYPLEGDYIGSINIPALNRVLPIYQGTTTKVLKNGVGHYIQSALPGENNNVVLSGHRETAFSKLNEIVIGDLLIVETTAGTFTYQVVETKIVSEDDQTIIVYTDHSVLTLTTCYPFNYLASSIERYIVIADLIK